MTIFTLSRFRHFHTARVPSETHLVWSENYWLAAGAYDQMLSEAVNFAWGSL